ncbi:MAG: heme-binding protein [Phycisphaerales bacterium]
MPMIARPFRRLLGMTLFVLGGCAMTGGPEPAPQVPSASAGTTWPLRAPAAGTTVRLLGDAPAPMQEGDNWFAGDCEIEAPLPVGYPPPTPPQCVEIKTYPVVRRAEFRSEGTTSLGMNRGFWPLFRHIQNRDIEMTSPVEMDYRGMMDEQGRLTDRQGAWTMSFLYRRTDQGPTGQAEPGVQVEDLPQMTVISIGLTGGYGLNRVNQGLEKLQQALASQDQWVAAGDPRALNYNGPSIPMRYRWSEVQIPVKPRNAIASSSGGSTR